MLLRLDDAVASPSALDSLNNYIGQSKFPGWYAVITQNRDSDVLTRCNFQCALKHLGGESDTVVIHRFGHWACGWWEVIAVKEDTPQFTQASEIKDSLEDSLVLDESAFSDAEYEAALETWQNCFNAKERLQYIRQHRSQFEFHGWADLMANVRGECFAGYALELLG